MPSRSRHVENAGFPHEEAGRGNEGVFHLIGRHTQRNGVCGTADGRPVPGTQGYGRMELEDDGGLHRNVQGGDYRLQGDTARPRIHGRAMARYRRAGNRA
ncbi:hypothetical protein [Bacteroides thetaiotaomicron]|uniref:hypothetical protein n=1 Tax=Bacteroides thetaiotaomicron TaxID=818 RepID=UPI0039C0D1B5